MAYVGKETLQDVLSNLANIKHSMREALMYHGMQF